MMRSGPPNSGRTGRRLPLLGPRWRLLDREGDEIATWTRWTAEADRLAALVRYAREQSPT